MEHAWYKMVTPTLSSLEEPRMKLKLCLVGESAVGKTSLIRRFVFDQFTGDYIATLGTRVTKRELKMPLPGSEKTEKVVLIIWDIMGQKRVLDLMREGYFHGAHGLLMVSDLTRPETLGELDGWKGDVGDVAGDLSTHLLANKADLLDPESLPREELEVAVERWGCSYTLTSAKTGEGVEEAFHQIAERIVKDLQNRREKAKASS